ncbi:hypothetical protein CC85DRAFT_294318 [Cutaneotrichosporon oleaginosum]|uniref:Glycosyltransferase family 18 catalytic domain-containing protein n=1 Tax=Cutaneotrichosporon oleaginosum TaxID=879819 RepID=A0A0J1ATC5_9TREE|nr:uncharacterized protein CC85DRAFT_294318 [Cutaneotrichosporon oleaginosum]KLT38569.1 hypothetical protein CC85DRAFT_294318 [Cutaneotrichosporon oleaginosum]TXT08455.1 hypothetical protein COLE_05379 [Cutaneotrichosporon oleaginosum]
MLKRAAAYKAALALCAVYGLLYTISRSPSKTAHSVGLSDACAAWHPGAEDPPDCLRAKQFREFQEFHASGAGAQFETHNRRALLAAERCALGITTCPERPLILIDYHYWWRSNRDMWGPGETVWGWTAIDGMREAGFLPIFINGRDEKGFMQTWALARALPSSVHAYLTDANAAVRCLLDPRCVRPADYVPHKNASLRFPDAPDDDVGVLPAWRVFGVHFWGARPQTWQGTQHPCRDWGQCGDEEWAYHPLGNKWVLTPYAYPGHTQIAMSVEQACSALPPTPRSERAAADGVLILAKLPLYFHLGWFKETLHALGRVRDAIAPTKLWTTANSNDIDKFPLPDALTQLGKHDPEEYARLLARSKVLLGVGFPVISPTPYEALCRGVPVVLPYSHHEKPTPDGWNMYHGWSYQHGPVMALGEPYAYSYNVHDPDDLVDKLLRALRTPIEPFIPPEMTTAAVYARVREVLTHDWEGEYDRIVAGRGMPRYPDIMVDKCFNGEHVAPCSGKYPMP